jgi:hypothetical protein
MASEQAFCERVFGLETASQAEYAGSIPVIGSRHLPGRTPLNPLGRGCPYRGGTPTCGER